MRIAFLTLGCKVNSYETDAIRLLAEKEGFQTVNFGEIADAYVVNTCSVTNIADRKSRQMLHRARQLNPDAVIAATGCYAQIGAGSLLLSGDADIVVGNNRKTELIAAIKAYLEGRKDKDSCLLAGDISHEKCYEDMEIHDCLERSRAFIKVEDGCNQFCTYCIIPYARGRVRSRSEESIISEVSGLAKAGYREVVLTGIHLSSYGRSDYEKAGSFDHAPLLKLIRETAKIDGIERIRLGSLEPRIVTREFAEGLASTDKFCPHFHLSLQSGCDSVLKRMNRHYTTDEFIERTELLKSVFDRPFIATDVIAGFPQETDEEFEASLDFVQKVGFSKMHIFKYSRRHGTIADRLPGQVPEEIKKIRSERLTEADTRMHLEYVSGFTGTVQKVLSEEIKTIGGKQYLTGLNERYTEIAVPYKDGYEPGSIISCSVKGILDGDILEGEII